MHSPIWFKFSIREKFFIKDRRFVTPSITNMKLHNTDETFFEEIVNNYMQSYQNEFKCCLPFMKNFIVSCSSILCRISYILSVIKHIFKFLVEKLRYMFDITNIHTLEPTVNIRPV